MDAQGKDTSAVRNPLPKADGQVEGRKCTAMNLGVFWFSSRPSAGGDQSSKKEIQHGWPPTARQLRLERVKQTDGKTMIDGDKERKSVKWEE